ncbi:MAG: L-threonylcarbamoyladenylate synthase [Planctomycetota bacterium]
MAPVILDLKKAEDSRDAIHYAVEALAAGKLIAVPTETVYGIAANGLNEAAVRRLAELKERNDPFYLPYAVKSADDALDFAPDMSPLARRLARRCWPGPLTLVLPGPHRDSVVRRLSKTVQQLTTTDGSIGLRVPFHPVTQQILRLSAGPTVMTSAKLASGNSATTVPEVLSAAGDLVDLVLDDGACRFSQPSTVVKIEDTQLQILRSGVLDEPTLKTMSAINILLVCTGNTCRSPMAEGLLRKRLADTLNCDLNELNSVGITVTSAGVAAMPGARASNQAVETMRDYSIDLGGHSSQPVTERLVQNADLILTMTEGHRQALLAQFPAAVNRTYTVARGTGDISDPIGLPVDFYRRCAAQIDENLKWWVGNHPLLKRDGESDPNGT